MRFALKLKDAVFSHPAESLYRITKVLNDSRKGDLVIIDIGAADGMVSFYFGKQFPMATIIGFEPNPMEFKKAKEVNRLNTNIEMRNLALSYSAGNEKMNILENSFSSSLLKPNNMIDVERMNDMLKIKSILEVKTSTLDHELRGIERIDLIKIDTQGTELMILKGGIEVLKRTNYILVEQNNNDYYVKGCQYYEVDEFLRSQGFELFDLITSYRSKDQVKEFDAIYIK